VYEIVVSRHPENAFPELELDGKPVRFVQIQDSGLTHHVTVRLPQDVSANGDGSRVAPLTDDVHSLVPDRMNV
jgi:hypothetical protein